MGFKGRGGPNKSRSRARSLGARPEPRNRVDIGVRGPKLGKGHRQGKVAQRLGPAPQSPERGEDRAKKARDWGQGPKA